MRMATRSLAVVWLLTGLGHAQGKPMLAIEVESGGYATVKLLGQAGSTYTIESKNQLRDPLWLTRGVIAAPAGAGRWTEPMPMNARPRFYRAAKVTKPAGEPVANMVWIPPGAFMMGSRIDELDRAPGEGPPTQTTITKGYWIGKYEVTQREYQAVMGADPSVFRGDLDRPVENVPWVNAVEYGEKLTAQQRSAGKLPAGYEYRLPTEAEWEYACRAGTTTRYCFGDALECDSRCGVCDLADWYMWWCGNGARTTHRVGLKQPNLWGLCDVHGNAWEWCWDWYSDSLPGGQVVDPRGPGSGTMHAIRGGSYSSHAKLCRSAYRFGAWPDFVSRDLGFRVVLAPVQ